MSNKLVEIGSPTEFQNLLSSSKAVVVDFYADWCGPCKSIAPVYASLSTKYSCANLVTFAKVNSDSQQAISKKYGITSLPTFLYFEKGKEHTRLQGADQIPALQKLMTRWTKIAADGGIDDGGSSGGMWIGASLPRGYTDITDQIDSRGLDLLNADGEFGTARTLFETSKPSSLAGKGKGKAESSTRAASEGKDWVESDTDEQLMLYIPFQATLKIHTLHITSLPPASSEDNDEAPLRPKTIHLYTNRAHNLGFEEADDIPATQKIEISSGDWDSETGTAKVELRFVKFQNVTSLVVFVVDGDGDGEKTRIDRIRVVGESGEKRDMGKLEKIGDDDQ
ncbi:DUF1000-domain-containing protein [Tothia fuscella]|uniref:DUF1000-domain-containing protein n=1 Tax=Tothia fuscella TaxID=1048955 RepID=A0A9P4NXE8_9PEZI|nr:DUF1000-domain-containing protein [Tothia fuscella]